MYEERLRRSCCASFCTPSLISRLMRNEMIGFSSMNKSRPRVKVILTVIGLTQRVKACPNKSPARIAPAHDHREEDEPRIVFGY